MELVAEVVNKLGGYLWHSIEDNKARVALVGESLGE
jgi:hypothetical protein